jgi:hypothetical protein
MADDANIGPALTAEREARMARWLEWVEALKREVWQLHHHRSLFKQMTDALMKASGDQTFFLEHYWDLYHQSQMSAIRRLVDQSQDAVSLTRLLTELAEHPETMTRAVHVALWKSTDDDPYGDREREANEAFDAYADGTGDNVNPEAVRRDLGEWKAASKPIKKWVDQYVAHKQAKPNAEAVSEDDFDAVIDAVSELVQKYTLLFTASWIAEMVPVIQGDWKWPFRGPLFPQYEQ